MQFSLRVNGQALTIDIDDPEMPLVHVLRDLLDLKGTKFGCLEGLCGACTVHVDGAAARACQIPVSTLAGREIVTIEGLSPDAGHPVQRAWLELRVPQCGWCQPGQIMQAAAFLQVTPAPDAGQIAGAMAGNLCRCGTTPRILAAVAHAAALKESPR